MKGPGNMAFAELKKTFKENLKPISSDTCPKNER